MQAMYSKQRNLGLRRHELYEVRPRKDRDGFDLISELLRYGPIWYAGPDAVRYAIAYAKYRSYSRSQRAIIRVLALPGPHRRDEFHVSAWRVAPQPLPVYLSSSSSVAT